MRPELVAGTRVSARIARAFEKELCTNVYAVLHLNRHVESVLGTRTIYVCEAKLLMKRIAQRARGKSTYRRLPELERFLPNAISIEKLDDGPHLNVMIRRPENWDFETFRTMFLTEWIKSPWAASGAGAIHIQPREVGTDLFGYIHKEGDETLVHETLRFHRLRSGA